MPNLYLVRGLPGSGKSTLAKTLCDATGGEAFAADDYFDLYHDGEFIPSKIKSAHIWCQEQAEVSMRVGVGNVFIHNTFTQEWEMESYKKMAHRYGYIIHQMIVENHHDSKSVHNVPQETLDKMRARFTINL